MRILILLMVITALVVPIPVRAAPIPCDDALFEAAVVVARSGVRLSFNHWQLIDPPYIVDYWRHQGKVLGEVVQIARHDRQLGEATRYNLETPHWEPCSAGNGWKNYLLHRR